MAGDKSIGENYAFAGMHHIFDQHTKAGEGLLICNTPTSRIIVTYGII